jgi:hypothetical protein
MAIIPYSYPKPREKTNIMSDVKAQEINHFFLNKILK